MKQESFLEDFNRLMCYDVKSRCSVNSTQLLVLNHTDTVKNKLNYYFMVPLFQHLPIIATKLAYSFEINQ